jgi:hypothetical protein
MVSPPPEQNEHQSKLNASDMSSSRIKPKRASMRQTQAASKWHVAISNIIKARTVMQQKKDHNMCKDHEQLCPTPTQTGFQTVWDPTLHAVRCFALSHMPPSTFTKRASMQGDTSGAKTKPKLVCNFTLCGVLRSTTCRHYAVRCATLSLALGQMQPSCCAVLCLEPHASLDLQCQGQHALGQHALMVTHAGGRPEAAHDSNT